MGIFNKNKLDLQEDIIMDKQELKKELLERYGDVVSHGHPALQNATPDKQLKMYPIMQFIREICFYS